MRTPIRLLIALLLLTTVLMAIPAQAAPPACGDTLTADTVLTGDLTGCPANGLRLDADNITLDCAGYAITGSGIGGGIGVYGRTGVTVKNCQVSGFSHGIIVGDGSTGNTVDGNTVSDNVETGINLADNNNTLRDNELLRNGGGLLVWEASGNTIVDTVARDNNDGLFMMMSDLNKVVNFTASDNKASGIALVESDANEISDSTATGNDFGFVMVDGSDTGDAAKSNIFKDNLAANNASSGFLTEDVRENTFVGNESHRNGKFGFVDTGGNTYKGNYCTAMLRAVRHPPASAKRAGRSCRYHHRAVASASQRERHHVVLLRQPG